MKKSILFIAMIALCAVSVKAQSLKDLLYSGKLKKDSNVVIRKGDDLTARIDTSTKKAEPEKTEPAVAASGSSASVPGGNTQSEAGTTNTTASSTTTAAAGNTVGTPAVNTAPKDNNRVWKEYVDSVTSDLKKEVLTNKKIKSDTYYLLVEYKIGTDGQTTISNVTCSPENSFLQQQVKERLTLTSPQLTPLVTNGKAREVTRKYNLTLVKP